MKVNGSRMAKLINNYNKDQKNKTNKVEPVKKKDQLSLSDEMQHLQNVKEKIDYSPQIRQEKVTKLKREIKQGNYNVNGEEIATDILDKIVDKRV
ncbi:flagellar biosynthesis anti-sigma factor FlgM [Halobacteroides halobius DSM 5150]|uniref:Negative regulator of flagellin synthesis n=1 Tax=Halobacteroides halobius (strain ATCC 35273 / DSM 5150 / MD-1) TaxID=748449 RepID=L0KA11_HALHC|nr:flagellar biosynthesis anti-sigma factor FlgM [Halobacteroides halobius]AGB42152.1 flagellar biosynthesis anti-sigma factor FlgM [Halobacteroides halobius DSM 5150]